MKTLKLAAVISLFIFIFIVAAFVGIPLLVQLTVNLIVSGIWGLLIVVACASVFFGVVIAIEITS